MSASAWGDPNDPPGQYDRGDTKVSIWDHDQQDQFEDDQDAKARREQEAIDSWNDAHPHWQEEQDRAAQLKPNRGGANQNRGGWFGKDTDALLGPNPGSASDPYKRGSTASNRVPQGSYRHTDVFHRSKTKVKRKINAQYQQHSIFANGTEKKRKKKPGMFSKDFWI